MIRKVARVVLSILGGLIFFETTKALVDGLKLESLFGFALRGFGLLVFYWFFALIGAIIFFILSNPLTNAFEKLLRKLQEEVSRIPTIDMAFGSIGLIISLLIAFLLAQLVKYIPIQWLAATISIVIYLFLAILGTSTAIRKKDDIVDAFSRRSSSPPKSKKTDGCSGLKILDTSVIIDGRIADICKTGFIEGGLIIPGFVLEELRHIADSSDDLKRNRGRRGLDILNRIQRDLPIEVSIYDKDFADVAEVDSKLLKLGKLLNAKVVTNDFNLNKVAEFQGVPVLNINDLANAVKPVVLPGEEMVVTLIKEGKEFGQAVAYLDDGTMIVVESGKKYIGETKDVIVTSVLQTSAGRMIFAKLK